MPCHRRLEKGEVSHTLGLLLLALSEQRRNAMVRDHQPGEAVFISILPEDIDWKPFLAFPPVRLAILFGEAICSRRKHASSTRFVQEVADDGNDHDAAWRTKPTFYAVSTQDRTINPDLERFMAKRMGTKTIEIEASHLALISHPDAITNLILEALAV
jgi:pimeloyl-ACP methyl ester carboxylesterase